MCHTSQADLQQAEANADQLQQQLAAAEGRLSNKEGEVADLQKQLESLQQQLDKTTAAATEKDSKVLWRDCRCALQALQLCIVLPIEPMCWQTWGCDTH